MNYIQDQILGGSIKIMKQKYVDTRVRWKNNRQLNCLFFSRREWGSMLCLLSLLFGGRYGNQLLALPSSSSS